MVAFSIEQYNKVAEKWAAQNPREVGRYGPGMVKQVVDDCFAQGLPTVISLGISFRRLQAAGKLRRVDGHDEAWDRQQDIQNAQANLDKALAEAYSQPITVEFEEYCASLDPRTLSRLYYGEDDDAINEFAIKYRRLANERGYRIPERFAVQS